ncbi:unnamed protein product, partial [Heterosigma akashiwo]
ADKLLPSKSSSTDAAPIVSKQQVKAENPAAPVMAAVEADILSQIAEEVAPKEPVAAPV